MLARRSMRGELALMLAVFGVTAALVSYPPPIDAASGPFSTNTTLGPAELEMTVDPARVGPNAIHLYLIDAKSGTQFTGTKELTVTATLPSKGIGPLPLAVEPLRPGPLHAERRGAVAGRDLENPDHRPGLRLRRVREDHRRPDPLSASTPHPTKEASQP